jgi:N-acetyl-gamma-glutamyl-phosphate reductase
MHKIFIDGREGTTGLEIHERLKDRSDLELLQIPSEARKDPAVRREYVNAADVVITCLPDAAAKETVAMIENDRTRVLDPSTAHRIHPDFVYGVPELGREQRDAISRARRVSNPGCHAVGFVSLLYPLVKLGVVPRDYPVTAFSLTGYSGGGRKMIEDYEASGEERRKQLVAPRPYGLSLQHKHIPEMQKVTGLTTAPFFEPVVSSFYRGMLVSVPLYARLLDRPRSATELHALLAAHYEGERFVQVMPFGGEGHLDGGQLDATLCNHTNRLEIFVFGNESQALLVARLDNLGKGASGSAVQNLNLMLGAEEGLGLS